MGTYQAKKTAKAFPPVLFGFFTLFFAYQYYHSRENVPIALAALGLIVVVTTILAPKAVIVTDANGIGRYFGRKLHSYYAWGDIEQVVTMATMSNDFITVVRGRTRPLPIGPVHENSLELVKEIRARATRAVFDDLTQCIASSGYPRRSPLALMAVLGVIVLAFCVLMAIIR